MPTISTINYKKNWYYRKRKMLLYAAINFFQQQYEQESDNKARRHLHEKRIPRSALIDPQASPWEKLYVSGDTQSFITVVGLDKPAFDNLLRLFQPYYQKYTPHSDNDYVVRFANEDSKRGRPRKINVKSCLALCLAYYRFKGSYYALQGWFGLTHTSISRWITFTQIILINILKNIKKYSVVWPNEDKIQYYISIIQNRHKNLVDCYCFADGLKLHIECAGKEDIQNRFYNGWQHSHYVTNLFVFGPDGKIIYTIFNAPGSIHDSALAEFGDLYPLLEKTYERTGGKCVMDSAFASKKHPCIIKSAQNENSANNPRDLIILREATSLRQAAEWGMRAIQSAFPRVKDTIRYEEKGARYLLLHCMILLYNYRCETVGLNQIRTVYADALERNPARLL